MPSTLSKEQKNNEEVDKLFQKKRLEASLLIIGAAHFSFFFDLSSGLDSFQHILTTLSNNNSAVQTSYVSNIIITHLYTLTFLHFFYTFFLWFLNPLIPDNIKP